MSKIPGAGFVFSLIMSVLLASQAIDWSYSKSPDREEVILKSKTPDALWLIICSPLIGLGLGIEVDKSEMGRAMAAVVRRYLGGHSDEGAEK